MLIHSEQISLRQVNIGETVEVVSIKAQGELGRRIRDMGLIPGANLQITGRAPLKDPVAIRLQGFTLSLRNNEADHIFVIPAKPEANSLDHEFAPELPVETALA